MVQTLIFISNLVFPKQLYWLPPHLLGTRLYTNTFCELCLFPYTWNMFDNDAGSCYVRVTVYLSIKTQVGLNQLMTLIQAQRSQVLARAGPTQHPFAIPSATNAA